MNVQVGSARSGEQSETRSWRIGVDVGGTFTDLVVADSAGAIHVHKVPTTPSDLTIGIMAAVVAAARAEGLEVQAFLERTTLFVHGSTIATNTVLEGKGSTVGLLVTEGFRDFLEIRRGHRDNPWDHRRPYPPVLVPRRLRLPASGRIDASGREVVPLDGAGVEAAVKVFREEGVGAVAICLMNSFLDGAHEARAAEVIRNGMDDDTYVSCSHSVASIIGEFERGSTTVLNAYVARRTVGYLRALDATLAASGMSVPLLLIQNNGGSISIAEVAERPVSLLLSGPAAGVGALAYYSQAIGTSDLISMEIGGTSCDVILMVEGKVPFSEHLDVAGYSYVSPSVEVHTVGAGGGTIARIDEAGLLRVGPEGAGARPGPSCYGLGGEFPTVTDAQVVLGRLKPGAYAGGAVAIDATLARRSVADQISKPLGISIEEAAVGVIRLMEQKLLLAVQRLSTERGHDPRRFTLVGGGGAGPLHVASVARALGCLQAYVPRLSGAFCALGMLGTDVRHDHVRVYLGALDDGDHAPLAELFGSLKNEALKRLHREGFTNGATLIRRSLDLRYVGQQWDITVPVSGNMDKATIRGEFDLEHDRLFGHTQPGGAIEITKARVTGIGILPSLAYPELAPASADIEPAEHRSIWIDPETGWCETAVYEGSAMLPGHRLRGPAIITEETTTVFVGKGDELSVDGSGNFLLRFAGADA